MLPLRCVGCAALRDLRKVTTEGAHLVIGVQAHRIQNYQKTQHYTLKTHVQGCCCKYAGTNLLPAMHGRTL